MERKKRNPYFYPMVAALLFVVLPMVACVVVFLNPFHVPGRLQVLDSCRDTSDGLILLTQSCNWSIGEPYTVSVYQHKPNDQWIWYYIDHESTYWWSGKVVKKGGKYQMYRGSALVAEVDPQKLQILQVDNNFVRDGQQISNPFPNTRGTPSP